MRISNSGTGGILNKSPLLLPRYYVGDANLAVNQSVGSLTYKQVSQFGGYIDNYGAVNIMANNTNYQTLVDISSGGFLLAVGTPSKTNASDFELKITVDGKETIQTLRANSNVSAVIGAMFNSDGISVGTAALDNNCAYIGVTGYSQQTALTNAMVIPNPNVSLARGYPSVRFDKTLKIEVRSSTGVITTNSYKNKAWCTYVLD